MVSIGLPDMLRLYLFPNPDFIAVDFLKNSDCHVPFGVSREVKMSPCCFRVSIHIIKVLSKSLPEGFAALANILLPAPVHCAGDGVDYQISKI